MNARSILLVAAGGAGGAVARYAVALAAQRLAGPRFPWGTFTANAAGCLLIGVVFSLAAGRGFLGGPARLAVMVGFLGAFTTFSTFALETVTLARDGGLGAAAVNVALNSAGGILLVLGGMWIGGRL